MKWRLYLPARPFGSRLILTEEDGWTGLSEGLLRTQVLELLSCRETEGRPLGDPGLEGKYN